MQQDLKNEQRFTILQCSTTYSHGKTMKGRMVKREGKVLELSSIDNGLLEFTVMKPPRV